MSRISEYSTHLEVLGFVRKNVPLKHHNEFTSLGTIEHAKFFSRIPVYLNAIRKSAPYIKACDVCYVFSLDILIWVYAIKLLSRSRVKLVYEVADIHPLLSSKSLAGKFVRWIERILVKRTEVTVFTSESFYTDYFGKVQRFTDFKHVTIENKVQLPRAIREKIAFRPLKPGRLTIGYFGLLKSPKSFEFLIALAKKLDGYLTLCLAGRIVFPNDIETCMAAVERASNIEYLGPYRSPEDLQELYESVDLVWDAYCEGDNSSWQRTTRFSESCFFRRPVIYNPETQDGKLAAQYYLGIPMTFGDVQSLSERLGEIGDDWLKQKFDRFGELPDSLVFYGTEYDELVEVLGDESKPQMHHSA